VTARRPLRIVAHNASRILGGGEIGTALLLAGLRERGHGVLMLCRDPAVAERISGYGIPTDVQPLGGDAMLPHVAALALRLRRERPDAVLLTTFRRLFPAALASRWARAPLVVQRVVLEGDDPSRGARYRLALRRWVDLVVLNADAMRAAFLAGDPALEPERVRTIVDGVATPHRARPRADVLAELAIPTGAAVVGSVGRLAGQKRLDRLVRAIAGLPGAPHLLLVGEGDEAERLRALARSLGVERRVHLAGFRSDVGDLLGAMDVFAVTSDREGLANAMLEAMAAGIPVVSTEVGGAREALVGGGDPPAGVIVSRDGAGLGGALSRLLGEPALRETLGAAGRDRAARRFGADRFLDEWEALLRGGAPRAAAEAVP
jgi:glycosyltransferase involved in cell wall biosynthesis